VGATSLVTATAVSQSDASVSDTGGFQVVVDLVSDLVVEMGAEPGEVRYGDIITYTAVVSNTGPDPATGVVLTDALPTGLSFISVESRQGSCAEAGGVVTCGLDDLDVGEADSLTLVAQTTGPWDVLNVVEVASSERDLARWSNYAVAHTPNAAVAVFLPLALR
jgi:uncharacterized repeat protein (TIGR01451 family)